MAPPSVTAEIEEVRSEPLVEGAGYRPGEHYTHRLISRRLLEANNSWSHDLAARAYNPAFMHPADLEAIGVATGDLVEIASDHGSIPGVAEASDDVPRGVISMAHAWGGAPERDREVREIGGSTNRLVNNARDFDPISGMARQSAIPVNVRPLTDP